MEAYMPDPYGAMVLNRLVGAREAAMDPLRSWGTNLGFDQTMTPAGFMGSALFGGGEAFDDSHLVVRLPKDKLNKMATTVTLWFKSGDIQGRKTLVVCEQCVL